ncbi:hypothetical protein BEK68_13850 [Ralstonia pickettii]|nr:hypothetical protein BEK68_13850 [Ralstonia pickettii]
MTTMLSSTILMGEPILMTGSPARRIYITTCWIGFPIWVISMIVFWMYLGKIILDILMIGFGSTCFLHFLNLILAAIYQNYHRCILMTMRIFRVMT